MTEQKRKLFYALFITGIVLIVCLFFRYLLPFIFPFIFAYWITRLMLPAVTFLERRFKIPRMAGGTAVITLFSIVLGAAAFFLFRTLISQLEAFLKNIPIYEQLITTCIHSVCKGCDQIFNLDSGATRQFVSANLSHVFDSVKTTMVPDLTEQAMGALSKTICFFGSLFFVGIATIMMIKDLDSVKELYEKSRFYKDIHSILGSLNGVLCAYFRMQGIVTGIIAVICTAGLLLIKNDYALLLGIFIAVFDAFPILGSGLILIPWGLIRLLQGDFYQTAILITIYLLCQLIRQTLEPRLLGSRIGVLPIFTVISIYIGIKLYGILGVFLGPLTLVTIQTVVKNYRHYFID